MIRVCLIDFEVDRRCVMLNIPSAKYGIGDLHGSKYTNVFGNDFFHVLHDVMIIL
jgi:hypothetical protein